MEYPIDLSFEKIGRDKKSWTATVKSDDEVFSQLKKALMSKDIEVYEKSMGLWQVTAGMRPVGLIHEISKKSVLRVATSPQET